jgi:two-component system, NarL family, sensor kinase
MHFLSQLIKSIVTLLLLVLIGSTLIIPASAQTARVDSLRLKMNTTSGNEKLNVVITLCKERNSFPGDSLLKYVAIADSLNKSLNDHRAYHEINYFKAGYVQLSGNLDSAIKKCAKNIEELKAGNEFGDLLRRNSTYMAALLIRNDRVKDAISLSYEVLKEAEKGNDSAALIASQNCIGWANMEISNFTEAVIWLKKAVNSAGTNPLYLTYPLCNLAATYNSLHKNDSALLYIERGIIQAKRAEDLKSLANAYAIKSDILIDMKNSAGAEEMMKRGMEIRKQIGDQFYVVSDMYQLGIFYANTQQCEKGIAICREGLDIAMRYKFSSKLIILYEALAENYKSCGNFQEYSHVLNKLIGLKDSSYKKNSAEALAEMQTKYEVENKEKIIIKQEYDLVRRNYLIYGSMVIFGLAAIITILVFKQYKNKQRGLALRAVSSARENERKRIAAELHDNIGTQLSYISRKIEFMRSEDKTLDVKQHEYLGDITNSARRSISDLRETIWALKKEEINLNDLSDRLKVFARQQLDSRPSIEFQIEVKIDNPILFSSVESLNIFRIMQEAIYNAIQHSEARIILLKFESNDDTWKISVSDNGKGFDTSQQYENHFGLENMEQRSKEIGALLKIESSTGTGTTVSLSGEKYFSE